MKTYFPYVIIFLWIFFLSIGLSTAYSILIASSAGVVIAMSASFSPSHRIISNWWNIIPLLSLAISSALYIKFNRIDYSVISIIVIISIYFLFHCVRNQDGRKLR